MRAPPPAAVSLAEHEPTSTRDLAASLVLALTTAAVERAERRPERRRNLLASRVMTHGQQQVTSTLEVCYADALAKVDEASGRDDRADRLESTQTVHTERLH
jgi:hypothetical protein